MYVLVLHLLIGRILHMSRIGCMESLVHYQGIILLRHASESERKSIRQERIQLLEELKSIDPARRQRYEEIGMSLDDGLQLTQCQAHCTIASDIRF